MFLCKASRDLWRNSRPPASADPAPLPSMSRGRPNPAAMGGNGWLANRSAEREGWPTTKVGRLETLIAVAVAVAVGMLLSLIHI